MCIAVACYMVVLEVPNLIGGYCFKGIIHMVWFGQGSGQNPGSGQGGRGWLAFVNHSRIPQRHVPSNTLLDI